MGKIVQISIENFKGGLSCSEAVVKACYDVGLVDDSLINIATSFSGGMQSGCICGAVAGAQMVIGFLHGRNKDYSAKDKAKLFIQKFKEAKGATCCKVLSAGYDFHSPERRENCVSLVELSATILEEIISYKD